MISALNVTNNILKRAFREEKDISPMKLQKILYIVYKEYYKRTGRLLFGEQIEAWKYGPVVRSVYDEFKEYGSNAIKRYYVDETGTAFEANEEASQQLKSVLDTVWEKYKGFDGIRLSEFTHKEGTAWYKAVKNGVYILNPADIKEEGDFIAS